MDDSKIKDIAACLNDIETLTKRKEFIAVEKLTKNNVSIKYDSELKGTERVLFMLQTELDKYDINLVEQAKAHTKKIK